MTLTLDTDTVLTVLVISCALVAFQVVILTVEISRMKEQMRRVKHALRSGRSERAAKTPVADDDDTQPRITIAGRKPKAASAHQAGAFLPVPTRPKIYTVEEPSIPPTKTSNASDASSLLPNASSLAPSDPPSDAPSDAPSALDTLRDRQLFGSGGIVTIGWRLFRLLRSLLR